LVGKDGLVTFEERLLQAFIVRPNEGVNRRGRGADTIFLWQPTAGRRSRPAEKNRQAFLNGLDMMVLLLSFSGLPLAYF